MLRNENKFIYISKVKDVLHTDAVNQLLNIE
mgnify:CR=1 FL=1